MGHADVLLCSGAGQAATALTLSLACGSYRSHGSNTLMALTLSPCVRLVSPSAILSRDLGGFFQGEFLPLSKHPPNGLQQEPAHCVEMGAILA